MIKAAFFDIDGTLLSFETHRVSEGTVRAFARLKEAGVRTFLSTGRPQVLIPPMPVDFSGRITMNGALVFTDDGEVLLSNPIPKDDYQRWLDFAEERRLCTMAFDRSSMCVAQVNDIGLALHQRLGVPMPPIVDIAAMRRLEAYQAIAIMPPELDAEVQRLLPGSRMPRWCDIFTDVVAAGNSKAYGMEAVCRRFGIRQEETIAFGDGGNDIEMLTWAGIGVAMGNASDEVKAAADMTTTDVDHEGIENAVLKVIG